MREIITTLDLDQTGGEFVCHQIGEGNNAHFHIHLSGGQYDFPDGRPTCFCIVGEWELMELAQALNRVIDAS